VRERVMAARERQLRRLAAFRQRTNAEMTVRSLRESCPLSVDAERVLERMHQVHKLSARGLHRLIKVARTVADLNGQDHLSAEALLEAASYRTAEAQRLRVAPSA
jgi:magnesium chelatase family protein